MHVAQLAEVADSAVLSGVVKVVSSIPSVGDNIFSAFSGIFDLLYLFIYIFGSKLTLLWLPKCTIYKNNI